MKNYVVNEIFCSLQGEGVRAGTANVFVRFSGCNMRCDIEAGEESPGGFACDTEFVSGRRGTLEELLAWMDEESRGVRACVLTGGEPGLQVDSELVAALKQAGWFVAIETNGSIELPPGIDWVCVSPKGAEHALRQLEAHEVKYVRAHGQGIPKPRIKAQHFLISPAFAGGTVDMRALVWCIQLVKEHPEWRLSMQQHKIWGVR